MPLLLCVAKSYRPCVIIFRQISSNHCPLSDWWCNLRPVSAIASWTDCLLWLFQVACLCSRTDPAAAHAPYTNRCAPMFRYAPDSRQSMRKPTKSPGLHRKLFAIALSPPIFCKVLRFFCRTTWFANSIVGLRSANRQKSSYPPAITVLQIQQKNFPRLNLPFQFPGFWKDFLQYKSAMNDYELI